MIKGIGPRFAERIVDRFKEMNMLDKYLEVQPLKDWSTGRDGGPRKRVREDLKI